MTESTFEKVLAVAKVLPPDEQQQLAALLVEEAPRRKPLKSIEQLMAEQGTGPVDFQELRRLGEFFPEDESVDDLVRAVREWRSGERTLGFKLGRTRRSAFAVAGIDLGVSTEEIIEFAREGCERG